MPRLAIVLSVIWFVSLFVIRSLLQWHRTGSTGMKGLHGRPGSLSWWAGASITLGFVLGMGAPPAALLGWPGGGLLDVPHGLHVAGAALAVLGIAGALVAQLAMGPSWRIGIDAHERTALVTSGPFALVRNPIFSFLCVFALGLLAVVPNALALAACALTAVGIELHVRAVEEPHLARLHGDDYRRYAARVGRFVPGVGRLHGPSNGATAAIPPPPAGPPIV